MQIWLARHAEAVNSEGSTPDFDRRLSEAGRKQMSQLGRWLKTRAELPDLILHSPLQRTTETADILRQELDFDLPVEPNPLLAPGMQCKLLLSHLAARTEQCVICIGHQPDVSRCLSEMLGGGRFGFSPGTMAGVKFPHSLSPGGGELLWLLPPRWFA